MYAGLNRLEDAVVQEGHIKVTYVTADGYNGAALTCGKSDTENAIWLRNGVELNLDIANGISVSTLDICMPV